MFPVDFFVQTQFSFSSKWQYVYARIILWTNDGDVIYKAPENL